MLEDVYKVDPRFILIADGFDVMDQMAEYYLGKLILTPIYDSALTLITDPAIVDDVRV